MDGGRRPTSCGEETQDPIEPHPTTCDVLGTTVHASSGQFAYVISVKDLIASD
jgi:hypothetical protein